MTTLTMAWIYVKKYWAYVVLIVSVIIGFMFLRRERNNFVDQLKRIQDGHDEEIKKIQEARLEEERQHVANLKRLQETLDVVQKQYDDAKKDLNDKKKREIEDLVKQYADDPNGLTQKLSEVTGFTIILPS